MRRIIAAAAVGIMAMTGCTTGDAMTQDTFPCHEDEVLGYDPSFGPDAVGCIHVEGDTLERP